MRLFRIFAIAAMAMLAGASAQAGVVLSNLGASGNSLAGVTTSSTQQTANVRNAAGFKIGANAFTLDSVSAALESTNAPVELGVSFAIYSDVSNKPGISIASSSSVNVGNQGVYNFVFSGGVALSADTKYWAVVETGVGAKWFGMAIGNGNPSPQNGSGLTFVGYDQTSTFSSSKTWLSGTEVNRYGFAVFGTEAGGDVPEPALTSLLCFGGIALIRRRMKK